MLQVEYCQFFGKDYPIYIGTSFFLLMQKLKPYIADKGVLLVTDKIVSKLYLKDILVDTKISNILILPMGEPAKSWENIEKILHQLINMAATRDYCIISLGGGVLGDMVGFAASIYMRGITWLHIPTTLLSQVDAAVGGKTGINFVQQKNLLGNFYHPAAIFMPLNALNSLPEREFIAGLAEVIKYGMACDIFFFAWLEQNINAILQREPYAIEYIVRRCCQLKSKIVAQDANDKHIRHCLNFGHTFAHALEQITEFKTYLHGEAVALGMLMATTLATKHAYLNQSIEIRLKKLICSLKLPINYPEKILNFQTLYQAMRLDKKAKLAQISFILPVTIGDVRIFTDIDKKLVKAAVKHYAKI